ncbi:hypothetical protein [Sphingomonas jatrophae]|uniref:Uncharacterized protein n=1 Tax=Sphingomonas jatrophae TaxID=1166337 RepID=A0A1I6M385_9SPHN|nr:hypothetical protein [Sphingomonas jatrophae]SFS10150.1 hypothetical protein SAMN05192580_3376 [Sphingomonas jatrophae]
MQKSATEVMQEIVSSAVLDALAAFKDGAKGLPNALLRDLNAIHLNTTFADLPDPVQAAITASVRAAFTRLQKEGYAVAPADAARPAPRPSGPPPGSDPRRRPSGPRPGPRTGPRPPRAR